VVSSFSLHFLDGTGSGADQDTDAYKCPPAAPYAVNKNVHDFAPFGTTLEDGVEIRQDHDPWYIGVVMFSHGLYTPPDPNGTQYHAGPDHQTNGLTHAHNWDIFAQHSFQVVLHCTGDTTRASCVTGTGRCYGGPTSAKPASRQSPNPQ
jgi:hypothetical protein